MFIDPKTKALNESVLTELTSSDFALQKKAENGVSDYLRLRAREDGFTRRIQPPVGVTPADLDRQVDTVKPVIVKDMEPNSPGGYSVPFGTVPSNHYMDAPRYRITFDRILSHRVFADVANLLTYDLDIRQIFNDFMLKDILAEEDRKYMSVVEQIAGATANDATTARATTTGALGWVTVGALTRTSFADARKGLPSTNRHLNATRGLVNNVTIWDVCALDRQDIGGDLAEELFMNGYTERTIMGLTLMITIKTDLVANDTLYQFAAPKFLGDFFTLEDVTVSTKHENYMFEMFAYEMIGATLKNEAAVCKVSFVGSFRGWLATDYSSST